MRWRIRKRTAAFWGLAGLALFIEGIWIQYDFSQIGIPSLILQLGDMNLWLHHWILGAIIITLVIIGWILGLER